MNKEQEHMKDYWKKTSDTLDRAMYFVNSSKNNWKLDGFMLNGKEVWDKIFTIKDELPDFHSVLEIGCGLGRVLSHTTNDFETSHGVDIDKGMIKYAEEIDIEQYLNLDIVDGTGDLSIFFSNSFSFIYSVICFQHIPYVSIQQNYIKEIERILKPNGIARLMIQNPDWGSADNDISLGCGMHKDKIGDVIDKCEIVRVEDDFIGNDGRNYWVVLKKGK